MEKRLSLSSDPPSLAGVCCDCVCDPTFMMVRPSSMVLIIESMQINLVPHLLWVWYTLSRWVCTSLWKKLSCHKVIQMKGVVDKATTLENSVVNTSVRRLGKRWYIDQAVSKVHWGSLSNLEFILIPSLVLLTASTKSKNVKNLIYTQPVNHQSIVRTRYLQIQEHTD